MRTVLKLGASGLCVSLVVLTSFVGTAHADNERRELAQLRSATAQFHDLNVATDAGYGEFSDLAGLTCIEDPGGAGAMGVHYVMGSLVGDGEIDVRQPEALLYDFSGSRPKLLGVEYIVFVADWGDDPPVLFGHEFHRVDAPNRYGIPPFYELHAWVWEHNPNGILEDWNPRIDC